MTDQKTLSKRLLLAFYGLVALLALALLRSGDNRVVVVSGAFLVVMLSVGMIVSLRRATVDKYTRLLLWMVLLPVIGIVAKVLLAVQEM